MPYEYRDEAHLAGALRKNRKTIEACFAERVDSLDEIVKNSVGGNSFRAFQKMPQKPSVVFRDWGTKMFNDKRRRNRLFRIGSQAAFDQWHNEFCCSFREEWKEQMGVILPFGASRKLPNLLLKAFVRWSELTDQERNRLIRFLHVSLDSLSLAGIRNCIDDPEIPPKASMRFVAGPTMYRQIQEVIRRITKRAAVPAIYYDVLVWNLGG